MRAAEIGQRFIDAEPKRTMTREESEIMVGLISAQWHLENANGKPFTMPDEEKSTAFKIIEARLRFGGTEVDDATMTMAGYLSDRAGVAVMYAAAIRAIYEKLKRKITIRDFIDAFPWGFPTEEAMHKVWLSQKIENVEHGPDNWLDRDTWKFPAEPQQIPR